MEEARNMMTAKIQSMTAVQLTKKLLNHEE